MYHAVADPGPVLEDISTCTLDDLGLNDPSLEGLIAGFPCEFGTLVFTFHEVAAIGIAPGLMPMMNPFRGALAKPIDIHDNYLGWQISRALGCVATG